MTGPPPLAERTIGDYLDRLGSSHPDPGGGSVAGLVGALAAGLGRMVIALTRNSPDLDLIADDLKNASDSLLTHSANDERAYAGFVTASRLPKSTSEEKSTRKQAMQAALVTSAEVPLELARAAIRVLDLLESVAASGTSHALSDAEIGVNLAETAVLAAISNVNANVPWIDDKERAASFARAASDLETAARDRATNLRTTLERRRTS